MILKALFSLIIAVPMINPDKYTSPTDKTIDFKATGNEPFWSLEMDFDGNLHFKSLNLEQEIVAPVPAPDIAQDHPVERYTVKTDIAHLIISISPDSCTDTMSGEVYSFTVTVEIKLSSDQDFTQMRGCGRFMLDDRLHNIWVLEEMDGMALSTETFGKGLPTLEIYAATGRIGGQDGCNRLFGKITGDSKILKFGTLGTTMMACPDMEGSNQFNKLINNQRFEYSFESRQLWLRKEGKIILKFKNVD